MPHVSRVRWQIVVMALVWAGLSTPASSQTTGMVEFFAAGKLQRGMPLVDLAHELVVIGRDGWMHSLDPRQPETQVRRLEEPFRVASAAELRNDLRAEFGRNFEVLATPNFLVVQPRGRGDKWPKLFEQSHRAFVSYMSRRGVNIRQGRFPMVAVVFPDQQEMYAEIRKLKIDVSRVAGLYSGDSNRVMTHDGGRSESVAATVRHEAAHQSAFNSGVHSRVNDTPRWITEGVGQMFEPVAMTDSRGGSLVSDRVNRDSLSYIKRKIDQDSDRFRDIVIDLVSGESMFENESSINDAYAVSWAMMFYLAERNPKAFATMLNHTATRPPFQDYRRQDRIRDLQRATGDDLYSFSNRVSRYIDSL
ncbi:MAG: DUF1570 domain-containing protein [Rubripirellula sp.]